MSQGLIENILVSGVFFLLDVFLIVLLLPFVLKRFEDKKWRPMRQQLIEALIEFHEATVMAAHRDFSALLQLFLCEHVVERSHEARIPIGDATEAIRQKHQELIQFVDLCAPGIEPGRRWPPPVP